MDNSKNTKAANGGPQIELADPKNTNFSVLVELMGFWSSANSICGPSLMGPQIELVAMVFL